MTKVIKRFVLVLITLLFIFSSVVFAHSPWIWTTPRKPLYILPLTLLIFVTIEYLSIIRIGKLESKKLSFLAVLIENILAFLLPYILLLQSSEGIECIPTYIYPVNSISFYAYLFILIKIILVFLTYGVLAIKEKNRTRLFSSLILSSIVGYFIVSAIEILICPGFWS